MSAPIIRQTKEADQNAVLALYPMAFPEEELRTLVSQLFGLGDEVLSLISARNDGVLGHVMFTLCGRAALLAPLGVRPDEQGKGIGAALVGDGLNQLKERGVTQVFVLGDPKYYGRFGFQPERDVQPPYPMPEEWVDAWQSLVLQGSAVNSLDLPKVWMIPALWME